jgi:hypothetical protein
VSLPLLAVWLVPAASRLAQGAPYPPSEQARERADEILRRDEFRPPEKSFLEEAIDWVDETVRSFLNSLVSGGAGSLIAWVVLGALVIVVALVVTRVVRTMQTVPATAVERQQEVRRSAVDWLAEAERLERDGDWKGALRSRYRWLVAELVERDVLRDVPGRTAGEYRVEIREKAPGAAPAFSGASELFERAWYGDLPTGPDENTRFRSLADDVLTGAHR